ncbi:hypothetical protein PMAYCL1PPCAC_33017, partial [Pristionchus mayeri]
DSCRRLQIHIHEHLLKRIGIQGRREMRAECPLTGRFTDNLLGFRDSANSEGDGLMISTCWSNNLTLQLLYCPVMPTYKNGEHVNCDQHGRSSVRAPLDARQGKWRLEVHWMGCRISHNALRRSLQNRIQLVQLGWRRAL